MKLAPLLFTLLILTGCQTSENIASVNHLGWWEQHDGQWTLTTENGVSLTINPESGARITSLKHFSMELLKSGEGLVEGSTFWSAPQSDWKSANHWPPAPAWDSLPYSVEFSQDRNTLILTGQKDPSSGLSFQKTISRKNGKIQIQYTITNQGSEPADCAPWEVTRVPTGGIAFFPVADEGQWKGTSRLKPSAEEKGILWYQKGSENNRKLFRDLSETWIAYALDVNIFLKELESDVGIQNFAPGEGEAEIYAGGDYVELENQGALRTLKPGESLNWTVVWSVFFSPQTKGLLDRDLLLKAVRKYLKPQE